MSNTSRTSGATASTASRSPGASFAWARSRSANVLTSGLGIGISNLATGVSAPSGAASPASPFAAVSAPAAVASPSFTFASAPDEGRVQDTEPSSWFQ